MSKELLYIVWVIITLNFLDLKCGSKSIVVSNKPLFKVPVVFKVPVDDCINCKRHIRGKTRYGKASGVNVIWFELRRQC